MQLHTFNILQHMNFVCTFKNKSINEVTKICFRVRKNTANKYNTFLDTYTSILLDSYNIQIDTIIE